MGNGRRKEQLLLLPLQLDKVETLLSEAFSEIDKAVSKGVIHKNTAARRKSRITHAKKALEAAALQ